MVPYKHIFPSSFSTHIASPLAGPLGAYLYHSGGYVCVFSARLAQTR